MRNRGEDYPALTFSSIPLEVSPHIGVGERWSTRMERNRTECARCGTTGLDREMRNANAQIHPGLCTMLGKCRFQAQQRCDEESE